ncbi:MAG: hypothetical protein LUQ25_00165 [Methanoregulaceae archaeon]|nr:hypothetical protein [Methanoregulaceae archaeon]
MDIRFCRRYTGDGHPPSNRFCRGCDSAACEALWQKVVSLSRSQEGSPVPLAGTRAVMLPNPSGKPIVHLRINCRWGLPKEDFLHFIATGYSRMGRKEERQDPRVSPSLTRQEPYVQAIVKAIGGFSIPEVVRVQNVQNGLR